MKPSETRTSQRPRSGAPVQNAALLEAWNATMRRRGGVRAVVEAATGKACTFRELDERAEAWRARHAVEEKALRGSAVVFAAPNGIEWFEIFLGLAKAGAVIVPLDAGEPVAAQRRIAETLRAAFWWDGKRLVKVGGGTSRIMSSALAPRRFRDPATCLIKLTSGTTGQPRPLVFTAAQMLADARQVTSTMGIRARDLNYALIPFGHSYGLGNLTFPLIAHGVPVVCGAAPLPHAIAEDFERWKPTVFPAVPAILHALVTAEIARESLASLRVVISAGAPLPPAVARDFAMRFGRRVHSFYGSSETGGIAYDRTGVATMAGGVGRPLRGVAISPVLGDRIRISGPAVFTFGNTRRAGANGVWIPGDRARVDRAGNLTLIGRRGATVKIAGRRVNLAEVGARLRGVQGVRDAWVGVSGGTEPVLGAAVVSNRTGMEIRAELLADTAAWKVPKKWAVFADFPLTARGKVDTRALHAAVFSTRGDRPLRGTH